MRRRVAPSVAANVADSFFRVIIPFNELSIFQLDIICRELDQNRTIAGGSNTARPIAAKIVKDNFRYGIEDSPQRRLQDSEKNMSARLRQTASEVIASVEAIRSAANEISQRSIDL